MQDFSSSFLHSWYVGLLEPVSILKELFFDLDVIDAGILGQGMIAENVYTLNVTQFGSSFGHDLSDSSIVVEPGETGYVLLLDVWSEVAEDVRVGVGRIGDDQALHIRFCFYQCLALLLEDILVSFEEVLAFHTGLARVATKKNDHICTLEHLFWLAAVLYLSPAFLTERTSG